jgi:hypothetical protein
LRNYTYSRILMRQNFEAEEAANAGS